jgi:DNA-binding NarL/FixJ family response regulator
MKNNTAILLVDDSSLVREYYKENLANDIRSIWAVHSVEEAHIALAQRTFDITIIDLHIPFSADEPTTSIHGSSPQHGFDLGFYVREQQPNCGILFFSNDTAVREAVERAISRLGRQRAAYLHKDSTTIARLNEAIERVLDGATFIGCQAKPRPQTLRRDEFLRSIPDAQRQWVIKGHKNLSRLTKPQYEVARLLAMGFSRTAAAERLGRTKDNIDFHKRNIREILFAEQDEIFEVEPVLAYVFVLSQFDPINDENAIS